MTDHWTEMVAGMIVHVHPLLSSKESTAKWTGDLSHLPSYLVIELLNLIPAHLVSRARIVQSTSNV